MSTHATHRGQAPSVTFWGAARSVTGSMHLVEAAGRKVLLDCGLTRSHSHEERLRNQRFPFAPTELDAVVVSHAHTDHGGNLPALVRQGYRGPIYCTPATRDLLAVMLGSSARIQEEEAFIRGVIGKEGDEGARWYSTRGDVAQVVQQCVPLAYDEVREVLPGVRLRLVDAGHILGSAMVALVVDRPGGESHLVFTGDLGRRGALLVRDAAPLPPADLLVCESTYGGRVLPSPAAAVEALDDVVRRTIERDGKVLVPTFSLGRMQVVVDCLQQAMRAGRVPEVPIYVDSPVAAALAEVYRRYPDALRDDVGERLRQGAELLDGRTIRHLRDVEESKELPTRREPYVLLAPGGMCEGGRILQHLKHHIDDPRCTILLVNYQAPHTPGRQLLERGPTVRFHGKKWNKWADVVYLPGFSGHADHHDLLAYLAPLAGRACRVRLVHGEAEHAEELAQSLREQGYPDVAIPHRGDTARVAC